MEEYEKKIEHGNGSQEVNPVKTETGWGAESRQLKLSCKPFDLSLSQAFLSVEQGTEVCVVCSFSVL